LHKILSHSPNDYFWRYYTEQHKTATPVFSLIIPKLPGTRDRPSNFSQHSMPTFAINQTLLQKNAFITAMIITVTPILFIKFLEFIRKTIT